MLSPFMRWMHTLPYTDVTVYRQATLLQTMMLAVAALSFIGSFATLLAPLPVTEQLIVMGITWTGIPVQLAGIALVRRGHFSTALVISCIGLLLVNSTTLLTTGIRSSGAMLFTFALPIVLAGLMGHERLVTVTRRS